MKEFVTGFLPVSKFANRALRAARVSDVIYGGVEPRFLARNLRTEREPKVLFVGRLLPHKGVNYLVEAVDKRTHLDLVGRCYDQRYFALLQNLARGKRVYFHTDASDEFLVGAYRSATVTVLPSVYDDVYGVHWEMPELLGLVLLESMASGTPVICTNVGGMPEFVKDGYTGFVVPPNDPAALRQRIHWLLDHPAEAAEMGARGRKVVAERYTWDAVARRCLAAYSA